MRYGDAPDAWEEEVPPEGFVNSKKVWEDGESLKIITDLQGKVQEVRKLSSLANSAEIKIF